METLEVPDSESPPRTRARRSTFVKEDLGMPELTRQVSDIKLSKKGTNVYVRFRPDNYKEEKEGTPRSKRSADSKFKKKRGGMKKPIIQIEGHTSSLAQKFALALYKKMQKMAG